MPKRPLNLYGKNSIIISKDGLQKMSNKIIHAVKQKLKKPAANILQKTDYALSPRAVNIDVTWTCNLKCVMCSAHLRVNKSGKEHLTLENMQVIHSQLPRLRHIYFMGLGEPLMNPYFFKILDYTFSNNINASLITNGMLLDEEKIKSFNDNLVKISVSIDSPRPEQFKKIRIGGDLNKIVSNLQLLKKIRPDIEIHILTVFMSDNIEHLPELVALSHDVGASCIEGSHIVSMDEVTDRRRLAFDAEKSKYYLKIAEQKAKEYSIEFLSRPLEPQQRPCWQPWVAPLIMLNGDVFPCCFMNRSPHPICAEWFAGTPVQVPFHQYKIGNIFEKNFSEIWNNEDFRKIRKTIRESNTNQILAVEDFNAKRKEMDMEDKYAYCRTCLSRWNSSC